MAKGYVLYNPLAGDGGAAEDASLLPLVLEEELEYYDITRITNYAAFVGGMEPEDYLVLVGGDGTLNRFVNDTEGLEIKQEILYYATGRGNDFARDLGREVFGNPFAVTQYLKDLPSVEVEGRQYRFLSGVGFGLDGYCSREADRLRGIPGKKVRDAWTAVKGILYGFAPGNAKITVDKKMYAYQKVWLASTVHGKYCGGMLLVPEQGRASGKLSLMLFHGVGRLRCLCAYSNVLKGNHGKHTKLVALHTGSRITVEFDRPMPLQIDGETILNVTGYTAKAAHVPSQGKREYPAGTKN